LKISRELFFVLPIFNDDGTTSYVHAAPISAEVFERYFLIIGKAFSAIYGEGLNAIAGPRLCAMIVRKIASDMNQLEDVELGLLAEIRRLANVAVLGPNGWTTVPFQEAVDKQLFSKEDLSEVENALTFFTVNYVMHKKDNREALLNGALKLWSAHVESSNFTEFLTSLKTSSATANTGEKAPLSSIPH
jgi:hypothetical protein